NYVDRSVELSMWINSSDTTDYRLLRNELYALFDTGNAFYIEETRVPSRVLKVAVDESFIPDRLTIRNASVDVTCRTLDSVFWESKYTTLELHDSGYSATAEKYGLVDNIDDEKVKYRFEPENEFNLNLIPLDAGRWERGARWSGGSNDNNATDIRLKMADAIPITEGQTYTFQDNSSYNSRLRDILVHCFDDKGNMVYHFSRTRGGNSTFTARGTKLVISLRAMDGYVIPLDYIEGNRLRVKVEEGDRHTGMNPPSELFTVYNAGNVTIEPESMYLHIIANTGTTPGWFTITNKTTGDEFVFNEEINDQSILLRGMDVRVSSIYNRFRDTNRRFISLAPGD